LGSKKNKIRKITILCSRRGYTEGGEGEITVWRGNFARPCLSGRVYLLQKRWKRGETERERRGMLCGFWRNPSPPNQGGEMVKWRSFTSLLFPLLWSTAIIKIVGDLKHYMCIGKKILQISPEHETFLIPVGSIGPSAFHLPLPCLTTFIVFGEVINLLTINFGSGWGD
jgi:hypothetical protein